MEKSKTRKQPPSDGMQQDRGCADTLMDDHASTWSMTGRSRTEAAQTLWRMTRTEAAQTLRRMTTLPPKRGELTEASLAGKPGGSADSFINFEQMIPFHDDLFS